MSPAGDRPIVGRMSTRRTEPPTEPRTAGATPTRSSDRLVFFTDAVVAIAMTLLILPLMETVSEAAAAGLSTAGYLRGSSDQLIAFGLSFVVIASFWRVHHATFEHVGACTASLTRLNLLWLLTIVWLPVPTALTGSLETDRTQIGLYIGSMLATSLVSLAIQVVLRRSPEAWAPDEPPRRSGLVGISVFTGLLAAALVVGLAFPGIGYLALLILTLGGPIGGALDRIGSRP